MFEKYIDGRGEKWKGWVEQFLTFGWIRKQLDAGDFLFYTHNGRSVGMEVKTVQDITSRLGDARRELAQLVDMVDIPILLVFGKWMRQSNDIIIGGQQHLTWSHMWNLIETFQDSGLRFQLATSREHAFLRINQLYAYYQKEEHTAALVARRAATDRRIASLMPIPGVSKKLGSALLKNFGSLQGIATAKISELETTPLIGPSKAKVIRDWHKRTEPYK